MSKQPTWPPLRCTRCGDELEIEYVYDGGAYSEFRSVDAFNCDCGATWDASGRPAATTWLRPLADVLDVDAGPPVSDDFLGDVRVEAEFQTVKWGDEHDAAKTDEQWFWTLGWLVGKAVRPGATVEKKRHRLRAAAALLKKWDEHIVRHQQFVGTPAPSGVHDRPASPATAAGSRPGETYSEERP